MKSYSDFKFKSVQSFLKIGDLVLLRSSKTFVELVPIYDPIPFQITNIYGTQALICRNKQVLKYNLSLLKKINPKTEPLKLTPSTRPKGHKFRSKVHINSDTRPPITQETAIPSRSSRTIPTVTPETNQPAVTIETEHLGPQMILPLNSSSTKETSSEITLSNNKSGSPQTDEINLSSIFNQEASDPDSIYNESILSNESKEQVENGEVITNQQNVRETKNYNLRQTIRPPSYYHNE